MGPIGCPETWVICFQYTFHNCPEERSAHDDGLFATALRICCSDGELDFFNQTIKIRNFSVLNLSTAS
jgi:hypothetical protein